MEKLTVENYIYKKSGAIPYKELTLTEKKALQDSLIYFINENTNFHAEHKE